MTERDRPTVRVLTKDGRIKDAILVELRKLQNPKTGQLKVEAVLDFGNEQDNLKLFDLVDIWGPEHQIQNVVCDYGIDFSKLKSK